MFAHRKVTLALIGAACLAAIFVLGGVYVVWRLTQATAQQAQITDPDQAAAVAQLISDYELPPGYSLGKAFSLMGIEIAAIVPTTNPHGVTFILFQTPPGAGLSWADIEMQLQRLYPDAFGAAQWESKEHQNVEVRGEATTLTIQEGTDASGALWRKAAGNFRGKSGPAGIIILGPATSWDDELIMAFLATLQ